MKLDLFIWATILLTFGAFLWLWILVDDRPYRKLIYAVSLIFIYSFLVKP